MKLNMDSIDLFPNDFLLAFITPLPMIALRLLPFSICDVNRSGYANRSTTGDRQNMRFANPYSKILASKVDFRIDSTVRLAGSPHHLASHPSTITFCTPAALAKSSSVTSK